jgi:sterol desaturase/sphingolipid hydroxylase (fatty acid hydroxylase superfamily)
MDWSKFLPNWRGSVASWLTYLQGILTEPRAVFWWPTLLSALAGALLVLLLSRRHRAVASELPSKRPRLTTYRPFLRELPVDLACLLGYTYTVVLMTPVLLGATVAATTLVFVAAGVTQLSSRSATFVDKVLVAALVFVCADFCLYWSHRIFHLAKPLWRLHLLHHQPRVLTPVTAFRFWPPEAAVHLLAFSIGEGLAVGVAAVIFGAAITPLAYAGVNAFLAAWYLAFSHLRHSHVAMPFPRWLSHLLVSPHMHQVHHSVDARHHHKNFGTALAVWDWIFGTLHVPQPLERFSFGAVSTTEAARANDFSRATS